MSLDDRTAQAHLTPDARRQMLRAFADRMLIKITALEDPKDLPGIERAVRTAAAIERIYSRCDRAERQVPDPRKLEAERANNAAEAIKARVHLAADLEWGEKRRQKLGQWWDAADTSAQAQTQSQTSTPAQTPAQPAAPAAPQAAAQATPETTAIPSAEVLKPNQASTAAREAATQDTANVSAPAADPQRPAKAGPTVTYVDYTDAIRKARRDLGLKDVDDPPAATGGSDPPS